MFIVCIVEKFKMTLSQCDLVSMFLILQKITNTLQFTVCFLNLLSKNRIFFCAQSAGILTVKEKIVFKINKMAKWQNDISNRRFAMDV